MAAKKERTFQEFSRAEWLVTPANPGGLQRDEHPVIYMGLGQRIANALEALLVVGESLLTAHEKTNHCLQQLTNTLDPEPDWRTQWRIADGVTAAARSAAVQAYLAVIAERMKPLSYAMLPCVRTRAEGLAVAYFLRQCRNCLIRHNPPGNVSVFPPAKELAGICREGTKRRERLLAVLSRIDPQHDIHAILGFTKEGQHVPQKEAIETSASDACASGLQSACHPVSSAS